MQSSSLCIKVSFSTILNLKILVGNSKNHACRSKKNPGRGTLLTTKRNGLYFGTTHFPISMLVLQFQKPTLQNVTVIPNGPSSALPAFYSSSSPTSSRVSQVVGSTLETWFRTNLNATPCHSTSLPFLTTSTKEEDKGKS